MKNTTFALMITLVGVLSMHTMASAQLLPRNDMVTSTPVVTQITTSETPTIITSNTTPTLGVIATPTMVPVSTTVITQISPVTTATASVINNNGNVAVISVPNPVTQITTQSTVGMNTLPNNGTASVINNNGNVPQIPVVAQPVVPITPPVVVPVTPVTTTPTTSWNGTYSVGSYNYGTVGYQAPAAPVYTTPVTYTKPVKINPIAESINASIAQLPDETLSESITDFDNNLSASTYGLGSVNLVTILLGIAVILAGMVVYQQYQERKKKEQNQVYA
jgi:hypothetical protein